MRQSNAATTQHHAGKDIFNDVPWRHDYIAFHVSGDSALMMYLAIVTPKESRETHIRYIVGVNKTICVPTKLLKFEQINFYDINDKQENAIQKYRLIYFFQHALKILFIEKGIKGNNRQLT